MRVAPQKEVMIGISNYNLINTGQLVSFLEVSAVNPKPGPHRNKSDMSTNVAVM